MLFWAVLGTMLGTMLRSEQMLANLHFHQSGVLADWQLFPMHHVLNVLQKAEVTADFHVLF